MGRQRSAGRLRSWLLRLRTHLGWPLGQTRLQILDRQLHLDELLIELLGRTAKSFPLEHCDLEPQLLELQLLRNAQRLCHFERAAALSHHALQSVDVVR